MKRTCSLRAFTATVAVWSITAFAANPALSGLYRVGSLGLVDFSLSNGEIVGRYKGGGVCNFELDSRVVSGSFEGSVFVGQVTLCQEGQACATPQAFPILGFYADKKLVTLVKFEPGCSSKATDRRQLIFREADPDDRLLPSASSAAIAKRNKTKMEQAADAVRQGQQQMSRDVRAAEHQFQVAITNDDTSAEAWLGLATAQIRLAEPQSAIGSLFKSLDRARSNQSLTSQVHYNLACAYALLGKKREAMKALKSAVAIDATLSDALETDPDLESLHGEKDFAELRPRGKR